MSLILTREWLKAAYIDLESITYIIAVEHLTSVVAFHSQQSIEKALKSLMVSQDIDIPKIHSLNKLFKLSENKITNYNIQIVNKLDKLYIDSRYPGDMGLLPYGKPTLKDAIEFQKFSQSIFDEVCDILEIDKSGLLCL